MSTLKEISETKTTVYIYPKESFLLSLSRDVVTFSLLGLCIYASIGSTWWTLVTGVMFILAMSAKLKRIINSSSTTFATPEAAIKFLEKQKPEAL